VTSERSRSPGRGRGRRPAVAALCLVSALATAAPAAAQQSLASNRFNFDFSNPGARSLGFGGAFAGLADDATAAFANPAGLVQLARPEVSLEGRWWERSPRFLAGLPAGADPDAEPELLVGRAESDAAGPSFASVVLPRGAWSFAVYGHQLSLFEIETGFEGLSPGPPGELPPFFSPDLAERVDLDIVTAGLAAARRLGERFSVGVAVVRSDISLTSTSSATLDLFGPGPIIPGFPLPPGFLVSRRELTVGDDDWTVHGGVLWRTAEGLSAGLFYRQGAEGEGRVREEVELFGQPQPVSEGTGSLSVPDVWGGGVAYRTPGGRWTFAAEVDRVLYGVLLREEIDGEEVGALEYPDAWQYRFGLELALLQRRPVVAFRLGGWQSEGDDLFGETVGHLAVGLGIAARRIQIDLAADLSDEVDTGSASFIYAF
jgi:hypothetical protein